MLSLALSGACRAGADPCAGFDGRWVGERTETLERTILPDAMIESIVRAMRWEFRPGVLVSGTEASPGRPEPAQPMRREGNVCVLRVGGQAGRPVRTLRVETLPEGRLRVDTGDRGVALVLRRP